MSTVILECAINGGVTTLLENPNVPCTAEQVADETHAVCAAGASVVHFHVRGSDGSRIGDYRTLLSEHRAAFESIRAKPAPLLWNTFPVGGECEQRFRLFRDLSASPVTRPDLGAYDIGSLNIVSFDPVTGQSRSSTYINTFEDVRYFLSGFRELGLRPILNIFEPGFIRMALVCLQLGLLDEPLLLRYYFSNDYGLPPSERAIEVYRGLLEGVRHEWFGAYIGADVLPYVSLFAGMGGHTRLGLEDYDYSHDGQLSNVDVVRQAAKSLIADGHQVATVADAARLLGLTS